MDAIQFVTSNRYIQSLFMMESTFDKARIARQIVLVYPIDSQSLWLLITPNL
jgi:hypothetical protein